MKPKSLPSILIVFLTLFGLRTSARADIVIELVETNTGVDIIGSGSLETLSGLTLNTAGWSPGTSAVAFEDYVNLVRILGGGGNNSDWYNTTFTSYTATTGILGTGLSFSSAPIHVGLLNSGGGVQRVYLPPGYVAGDPFSYVGSIAGATLASMNHADGDIWGATWNTGAVGGLPATESMQFRASTSAIPEPASAMLVGLGLGVVSLQRRKRTRQSFA